MIEADALQIHLNVIQELVMPEGTETSQERLIVLKRSARAWIYLLS